MSNSNESKLNLANTSSNNNTTTQENYEFNWSTSLIPRPLSCTTNAIKNQIQVKEYDSSGDRNEECTVCLNIMEAKQLMRDLRNCSHVFHKECIDAWIDKNNVTCPLCRADLLYQNEGVEFMEAKWA